MCQPKVLDQICLSIEHMPRNLDFSDLLDKVPAFKMATRNTLFLNASDQQGSHYLFGAGMVLADAIRAPFEANSPFQAELDLATGLGLLQELYRDPESHAGVIETLSHGSFLETFVALVADTHSSVAQALAEAVSFAREFGSQDEDDILLGDELVRIARHRLGDVPLVLSNGFMFPVLLGMVGGGLYPT